MIKRILWLMVSSLIALSLVLAACAPKVTEEKEVVTEEKEVVTEKKEVVTEKKEVVTEKEGVEMVLDALGRLVPKPQYGGVLNLAEAADPVRGFSRTDLNRQWPAGYLHITNEPLANRDRLRGPGGSGEWEGMYINFPLELVGALAESWEVIQPDTIISHIRKGVHWQDKAPTYGAELTAEDVVYTYLSRYAGKWATSGYARMYPVISDLKNAEKSIYIDPDDPWAVVFKSAPGRLGMLWELVTNFDVIVPKALGPIEGEGFGDWRGVVGTGAMLLTDYVRGASLTWQRNPNYWGKDQFHPQNQLPYLDGVKIFIIPDLSTQQAALRTGKIDIIPDIISDQAESLRKTNPELLWKKSYTASALSMRNDVVPFNDVRVRRAMMMAIDKDEMVTRLYKGDAKKFYYPPWPDVSEHKDAYVPLEQMPRSVQELYEYHPDKAKQLLAEAGYPNGFSTSVTISAASEENIDLASVVAAYWAKVGVTLKIDIREPAVYTAMTSAFTYPHGVFAAPQVNEVEEYTFSRVGTVTNRARINEPLIEETYKKVAAASFFNWAEVMRITREATPKIQELAVFQLLPLRPSYIMWQPWLKGFHGEGRPAYIMDYRLGPISRYVWIDQELRKARGR